MLIIEALLSEVYNTTLYAYNRFYLNNNNR